MRHPVAAFVGLLAGLVAVVAVSRAFSVACADDAPCVTLAELRRGSPLPEALRIYDRDGVLLAEVAGPLRRAVPREEIPDVMVAAFVAIEDRRFWDHGGVDLRGVARAALRNVRDGEIAEGASTIPMQLVRTLWGESLRGVGPWRRKVIEARTAPALIDALGHERVLTLYLNAIYLGDGIYGVERAARHYFGVPARDLSLGQIATLVGMTRSPESYGPRAHPERAKQVRDMVLRRLAEAGIVTADEAAASIAQGLELGPPDVPSLGRTHLSAAATREMRRVAPEWASTSGLVLRTTIDASLQASGETALLAQLKAIEEGRYGRFVGMDASSPLEGAAVALDPTTGAVRAWVGGRDFTRSEFDRVDQARRQVGSLVKPFLVAAALEAGYGIVEPVSADTLPIHTPAGDWLPADHVTETVLPLREALVHSSNRAAAHLGEALGLEPVVTLARRAGVSRPIPNVPATAIGAFDASLIEMTGAYAAFGNGGFRVEPHLLTSVELSDGTVVWSRDAVGRPERILDAATAFVVLDALRAVVDRGTATAVRSTGYQGLAAGKTGTTNDGKDAWFVGLTPELAAGVWIGFDQPREIVSGRGGGALAAPVWGTWMRSRGAHAYARERDRSVGPDALEGYDGAGAWVPPPGVEHVRYDPSTGEVLDRACEGGVGREYEEAWVHLGRYERRTCGEGLRGLFRRVWRAFVPG